MALVVDDDTGLAFLTKTLLEEAHFQVAIAYRGREALDLLGLGAPLETPPLLPDLIVLDYELPDMKGYEILRLVRESERARDIPVIMLTATNKDIKDIVALDLDAFLAKPYKRKAFLDALVEIFAAR